MSKAHLTIEEVEELERKAYQQGRKDALRRIEPEIQALQKRLKEVEKYYTESAYYET